MLDPSAAAARPVARRDRVAVAGSCLTRDSFNSRFNPGHDLLFEVCATHNQGSMIALMSPPIEIAFTPTRPMNAYDRWNIRADLTREFLSRLAEEKPDILLLDFQGDVRFGVAQLPDGRYLTDHHWKTQQTDFYERAQQSNALRVLRPWEVPETYFALWSEALDRFAEHVRRTSPETEVVVHRGHHARRLMVPGRLRPVPLQRRARFRDVDPDQADEWWARLDQHAIDRFGWQQIDLRDLAPPTYRGHPWGAGHLHFTPDYHHRFLAELTKIALRRRLDTATMARIELIERAAGEPWQRRLGEEQAVARARRKRLRSARRRIAELEAELQRRRHPGLRERLARLRELTGPARGPDA